MATNGKSGDNRRHGAVKKRSQVKNLKLGFGPSVIQKPVSLWMERHQAKNHLKE